MFSSISLVSLCCHAKLSQPDTFSAHVAREVHVLLFSRVTLFYAPIRPTPLTQITPSVNWIIKMALRCFKQGTFSSFTNNLRRVQRFELTGRLMVHSCLHFGGTTGSFTRPFFRRSVSSSSTGGDAKTTVANTAAAAAAFKGAKSSRWRRFVLKPFVFVQFFFGIGLLAMALQQFRRKNKHPSQSPELIAKDWEVH